MHNNYQNIQKIVESAANFEKNYANVRKLIQVC
jgi:hypothetical protein